MTVVLTGGPIPTTKSHSQVGSGRASGAVPGRGGRRNHCSCVLGRCFFRERETDKRSPENPRTSLRLSSQVVLVLGCFKPFSSLACFRLSSRQAASVPCVAKWLQTDINYIGIIYRVSDTDLNCLGINYGVADTDLAL